MKKSGSKNIIPWYDPQITDLEKELAIEVLNSNYINEGDVTLRFEKELARLLNCKHVVTATSGTAALFLALEGLGIGAGDEVIVPDVTFIATANAVILSGATPVLVDINPKTLNMSLEALQSAITPQTKAIIPVHVSGRGADMTAIVKIADSRGIQVIEDAAEGFMSKQNGKNLGTIGKAGILSFSPNKIITTGQGGAILTDDDNLCNQIRKLKDQGRPVRGTGGDDVHNTIGYNFKFTNLQAAVGIGQLSQLDFRLKKMKEIYKSYKYGLSELEGISLFGFNSEETPQWVDVKVENRDELYDYLLERGIQCRKFWFPIHSQLPYRLRDENFPNSTRVIPHAMWLPSAFTTQKRDIEMVCEYIKEFC